MHPSDMADFRVRVVVRRNHETNEMPLHETNFEDLVAGNFDPSLPNRQP
jgi:hypothetical protein